MVEKKGYAKPAVESEDAMEQTSLACNSTVAPPPGIVGACGWGENLHSQIECEIIPWKGGNWSPGLPECSVYPFDDECYVVLS